MDAIHSKWRKPKPKKNRKSATSAANLIKARANVNKTDQNKNTIKTSVPNRNSLSEKPCTRSVSNNTVNDMQAKLQESATTRKLAFTDMLKSSSAVVEEENMFININVFKVIADKMTCECCKTNSVNFELGQRNGFAVNLLFICKVCGEVCVDTFSNSRTDPNKNNSSFVINEIVVQSFTKVGLAIAALQNVCASINMHCISTSSFYRHMETVKSHAIQLKREVLSKSRKIVHQVHKSLNPDLLSEKVIDILFSYDGSWHKRGFTSLYGFGCVIDAMTGLAVVYEVLSKYCHMCTITEKDLGSDSPEFDIWYKSHKTSGNCNKNYDGSSGSMELAIAEILWRRSVSDCEMRYMTMLSDGDAKTFNHLSSLNIYSDPLAKEECINHVAKRLFTALREIVKSAIYERLSNEELLARCTQGRTQNANEAIHSVLWRKCSINNSSSKTRVEIAAAYAVSEHNLGRQRSAEILASITNSKMTSHAEKITTQKNKKRKLSSDKKHEPESKAARISKKYSNKLQESLKVQSEGVTHGAGCF